VAAADQGQFDLYLLDLHTSALTRLTRTTADERQPVFAGDGRTLWFVRRDGSNYQLVARDLGAQNEHVLAHNVMRAIPDGSGGALFMRPFQEGLYRTDFSASHRIADWPDLSGPRNFVVVDDVVFGLRRKPGGADLMRLRLADERSTLLRSLS